MSTLDLSDIPRTHRRLFQADLAAIAAHRQALVDTTLETLAERANLLRSTGIDTNVSGWFHEPIALAARAAELTLGLAPHENQVLAAVVMCYGALAEVRTGEGKTLAATMPTAAFALAGERVHVMTANEYLATRDAEWMSPVYAALGLTVAAVDAHPSIWRRQQAYACDICYGTASQFGFDYLNDHLVASPSHRTQGPRQIAIVDEADALLLDDARTPLIISGSPAAATEVLDVASFVATLPESAVDVDRSELTAMLNEEGFDLAEAHFVSDDLTSDVRLLAELYAALRARFCYERDKDYLVADGRVLIIDESTGRTMPDRRWQNGLHEAIEAKEGLEVQLPAATLASITVPAYLAGYDRVAAMTGTASSDAEEFGETYGLHVFTIPTHKPLIRKDAEDLLFASSSAKFMALTDEVVRRVATGQPILIGAPTVADAERISAALTDRGVAHELLTARNPAHEAEIIAQAGRSGTVTVATNMAGRGVDILLGGDPVRLAAQTGQEIEACREDSAADRARVLAAGGLAVLATARHSSRRIDDQLRGRAGRQGEPGFSQFYLSLDDDLLMIFANPTSRALVARAASDPMAPVSHSMVSRLVAAAQDKMESLHRESRKKTNEYATPVVAQQQVVYAWRTEILTADPRDAVLTLLRPAYRTLLEQADVFSMEDEEFEVLLSFSNDLAVDWCDDETVGMCRKRKPDTPQLLAERCLEAFVRRNESIAESEDLFKMLRSVFLTKLDEGWTAHLADLDATRDGVGLRTAAQLNAQREFVRESSELFERFTESLFVECGQLVACGELRREPLETPAS